MVRVLTLDDEPQMGRLIALILEAEGYECVVTGDTYEAWALLHTLPFDALTQDTLRPDLDGVEFFHLVRADASLAHLAVVMVTAVPPDRAPGFTGEARLDGYLTKPFRRRELAEALREALRRRGRPAPAKAGTGVAITPAALFRRLRDQHDDVPAGSLRDRLRAAPAAERLHAARALGEQGDAAAVEPLRAALADPDAGVRWAAALALGRIGAPGVAGSLASLLRDDDERVRIIAARALGQIRAPGAGAALIERLDDGSEWVCRAAIASLGEIGSPEAIPALARMVHAGAPPLCRAAGRALGHIGPPAVGTLVAALDADDPGARRAAILGLSRVEDEPRADRALAGALRDPDDLVREAAAHALGDRDPDLATGPLVAALRDPSPDVAAMAATALAWLRGRDVLPELERVARDDTRDTSRGEPVAQAARAAIHWIETGSIK